MSRAFLLLLAVLTLAFGVLNTVYFEMYALAGVQFTVLAVVLVALWDLHVNRNVERTCWISVIAFAGLALFFYWYVRGAHSAAVWMVYFVMVSFFLLGTRQALPVSLAFSLALTAMIVLGRSSWPESTADATLSNVVGALVAFGLTAYFQERSRERAYESVRQLANTDWLTGLPNRRHFMEAFAEVHAVARAENRPFALLIADIDSFKAINDSLGHVVGDEVIVRIAARIAANVREGDVVGRLGGEEFGILLVDCGHEDAAHRAEALRERIAREPVAIGEHAVAVTISIGVAEGSAATGGFATLFARADRRLYLAKAGGRNRVVATEDAAPAAG